VIFQADKNLGPCIIERSNYIKHALHDHLLDDTTYLQRTPIEAKAIIKGLQKELQHFIKFSKKTPGQRRHHLFRTNIDSERSIPEILLDRKGAQVAMDDATYRQHFWKPT
jgi:hypothetical protein